MTGGTTRQNLGLLNLILDQQIFSFADLLTRPVFGRPFHIEDLFFRPHESLRTAMTFKTPLHLQSSSLVRNRHLIDPPMTRRAADPFIYVNAVIEIGVVRKIVNSDPLDRFTCAKAGPHWFQVRTVSPDLLVTVHADLGRRHSGKSRRLDRTVTITTVNAVVTDVVFVTELNRLLPLDPRTGVPG